MKYGIGDASEHATRNRTKLEREKKPIRNSYTAIVNIVYTIIYLTIIRGCRGIPKLPSSSVLLMVGSYGTSGSIHQSSAEYCCRNTKSAAAMSRQPGHAGMKIAPAMVCQLKADTSCMPKAGPSEYVAGTTTR